MKRILFMLSLAVIFIACGGKTDKISEQIKASVIESAFGQDLNYKPIETIEEISLSYQDNYDVIRESLLKQLEYSVEENIDYLNERIQEAKEENNASVYHLLMFCSEKVKEYSEVPTKTDVSVKFIKHTYSIVNPLFDNQTVKITNYYVFDKEDNLLGEISDDDFESNKRDLIAHEKLHYLISYFDAVQ